MTWCHINEELLAREVVTCLHCCRALIYRDDRLKGAIHGCKQSLDCLTCQELQMVWVRVAVP